MIAQQQAEVIETSVSKWNRPASPFDAEQLQLLERLESRLSAGLTNARLAVETGIRIDQIEKIIGRCSLDPLNGYRQNTQTAAAFSAIAEFLARIEADEQRTASPKADTPTGKVIYGAIRGAHVARHMAAIIGTVGVGKTREAEAYCRQYPRRFDQPGAVRVQFSTGDTKTNAIYGRILEALRPHAKSGGRSDDLLRDIVGLLRPGDHIIGDECQNLGTGLQALQDVHEAAKVGISMIGNFDFGTRFKGKQFEALASRSLVFTIPGNTDDDVDAYLAWAGISGADLRRAAVALVKRPGREGGLRALVKIIDAIRIYYPGRDIDAAILREAVKTFGGVAS